MYGRAADIEFAEGVPLATKLRTLADVADTCRDQLLLRYDDVRKCSLIALSPTAWHHLVVALRDAQVAGRLRVVDPADIAILARDVEQLWKEYR